MARLYIRPPLHHLPRRPLGPSSIELYKADEDLANKHYSEVSLVAKPLQIL